VKTTYLRRLDGQEDKSWARVAEAKVSSGDLRR
jgi:hypothetical protein